MLYLACVLCVVRLFNMCVCSSVVDCDVVWCVLCVFVFVCVRACYVFVCFV